MSSNRSYKGNKISNIIDEKQNVDINLDSYKNFSEFKHTEVLEKTKKR